MEKVAPGIVHEIATRNNAIGIESPEPEIPAMLSAKGVPASPLAICRVSYPLTYAARSLTPDVGL